MTMLNTADVWIQAIPEGKIITPFDSNANFLSLCHFISSCEARIFQREDAQEGSTLPAATLDLSQKAKKG